MRAFKGFNQDIESVHGAGTMKFEVGRVYEEPRSKTACTGFHCAEDPLECLRWYPSGRYFIIDAEGDIDECEDSKIACTKIRLVEEIDTRKMLLYAMEYRIFHPKLIKPEPGTAFIVAKDIVSGSNSEKIIIAYGADPKVRARSGTGIGILKLDESGAVVSAGIGFIGKAQMKYAEYGLDDEGKIVVSHTGKERK